VIGQVRMAQGDLKTASQAFTESLQIVSMLADRDPSNTEWQLGFATSHFYVGDAMRLQGDLDGAMQHFSAYRDIARNLVAREPANSKFLLELSYGLSNAAALEARGPRRQLAELISLEVKRRLMVQIHAPNGRSARDRSQSARCGSQAR
jgi:cytochrome c-type biogenesis protein CcmH/NrfG